jgi:hypothetical protein
MDYEDTLSPIEAWLLRFSRASITGELSIDDAWSIYAHFHDGDDDETDISRDEIYAFLASRYEAIYKDGELVFRAAIEL